MGEQTSSLPTMLGGATAGVLARFPVHPIDTCKARLQVQGAGSRGGQKYYKNFLDALVKIARNEGIGGLYRGFGVTALGSGPATCLYFTSYEFSKRFLGGEQHAGALQHLGAGLLAEALSCVLWVPIDVVKERMQIQTKAGHAVPNPTGHYYKSTTHAFQIILRNEGIRGIYKGYGATIGSFGPFSALYFAFYEKFKSMVTSWHGVSYEEYNSLSLPVLIATSSAAGCAASFITNPLDLVKLRLQVQRANAGQPAGSQAYVYGNMLHGLKEVVAKEGFMALFKGAGARMAFHAPTTALTMSLFERCKGFYQQMLE